MNLVLGGFYWRESNLAGAYFSIVIGILWGVFCYLDYGVSGLYTWYWAIYGIPLIFISGILVSYLSKKVNLMWFFK
jgi:solute:Na+ symporter, SSS family